MRVFFHLTHHLKLQLKCSDDFDTVKKVHDYLCNNFEYDYREQYTNYTDIEGFRDGRMVCQGYALATYYLLNACGVQTRIITGYGGENTDGATDVLTSKEADGTTDILTLSHQSNEASVPFSITREDDEAAL